MKDLLYGHIGAMDVMALSLERAARMIENDVLGRHVAKRYVGWYTDLGKKIIEGDFSLASLAEHALADNLQPERVSGTQERLENIVTGFLYQ